MEYSREASYHTTSHFVLGVRGDEPIEVGPFIARRMRSRSPELTSVATTVVEGLFEKRDNTHAGSTLS